jgi:hypothetical protein
MSEKVRKKRKIQRDKAKEMKRKIEGNKETGKDAYSFRGLYVLATLCLFSHDVDHMRSKDVVRNNK